MSASQVHGLNQIPTLWLSLLFLHDFFFQQHKKREFPYLIFFSLCEKCHLGSTLLWPIIHFFHLLFLWLGVQWGSFLVPGAGLLDRLCWLIGLCHFLCLSLLSFAPPVGAEPHWEQPTESILPELLTTSSYSVLLLVKQKQKSLCGLPAISEESNCALKIFPLLCS